MFFILCQTINVLWNMIQLYLILTNQKLQVLQKQTNKTFLSLPDKYCRHHYKIKFQKKNCYKLKALKCK